MIALLLLLGAPPPPVVVVPAPPPPPRPTLWSETIPAFDMTCTLVDRSFARHELALQLRGGRGYLDPKTHFPRRSRVRVAVLRDGTGLFGGDDGLIGDSNGYRVTRVEANHPEQGPVKLETFHAGRDRVAALVYTNALARIDYTGFCDTVRHRQEPLSEAETREYLKR